LREAPTLLLARRRLELRRHVRAGGVVPVVRLVVRVEGVEGVVELVLRGLRHRLAAGGLRPLRTTLARGSLRLFPAAAAAHVRERSRGENAHHQNAFSQVHLRFSVSALVSVTSSAAAAWPWSPACPRASPPAWRPASSCLRPPTRPRRPSPAS